MFGHSKKDEFTCNAIIAGRHVKTDFDGYKKLLEVEREMFHLKMKNNALQEELKAIKPVIESPDYKPPKSKDCSDCQYAVYSPLDRISVIGCRKDSLCEDFKPKET